MCCKLCAGSVLFRTVALQTDFQTVAFIHCSVAFQPSATQAAVHAVTGHAQHSQHSRCETLTSQPFSDVDLPLSLFLEWVPMYM